MAKKYTSKQLIKLSLESSNALDEILGVVGGASEQALQKIKQIIAMLKSNNT